jgi:isopentenyl diphosphate isomerase/L-lactate dehydrogenase-like FMN-dependent dehydrogenase/catechol 2,3-dioxygenase-like lactoylglutathione lyase family enzyme
MSLVHLTLATRDIRKAETFFAEALGWRPISRPNNIGRPAAWLEIAPGQELHLVEVADFAPSPFEAEFGRHVAISFRTRDFEELKRRLLRHGATLIEPERPTPFARLFFRNPDGYVFEVVALEREAETTAPVEPSAPAASPLSLGAERQMEIYLNGLKGHKPGQPLAPEELEERARTILPTPAYIYVAGGAGAEETMRANREAFRRWRIVPRFLRDVSRRDLSVELLGRRLPAPVLVAPVGVQSMLHAEAELAVARAARSLGVPMVLSCVSSTPLEKVAEALGDAPRWFQLYWPKDPALAASLVGRAERAGYGAVVVTLDTYLYGWRERDLGQAWLPFAHGQGIANYLTDPIFRASLPAPSPLPLSPAGERGRGEGVAEKDLAAAARQFLAVVSNPALTWDDLAWLRRQTRLPILLKGILHPDDARRAVQHGVEGVIVSNHGGRQVDGAVASLDALPAVVEAVAGRAAVLFDGGIRRGADVFKALALGAQAVLLGRPYCWGLAVAGEQGVREVLLNMLADIELTLGLAGCASCADVRRDSISREMS